jgi:putative ABC transport system permease protein
MSARNALLRMARRQVVRHKLRTLLIVALIAFPVAAVTMAEVILRSSPLSTQQNVEKELGGADARLTFSGDAVPVAQTPDGMATGPAPVTDPSGGTGPAATPTVAELRKLLPGATVLPELRDEVLIKTPVGAVQAELTGVELSDPKVRPPVRLVAGAWSTQPDGVVIGTDLAKATHLTVGGTLTLRKPAATLRVVGIVSYPYQNLFRYAAVSPATYLQLGASQHVASWLVSRDSGVSWSDVQALNQRGVFVFSREVQFHPPPRSEVPAEFAPANGGAAKKAAVTLAVAIGMAVLQLALLAGPAFAVSARRRQRDLALIAATGGDRPVLRRTLLAEGVVLGVLAAVLGSVLGIALAVLFRSLNNNVAGPLRLRPAELSGIAALGVLAALAGALLPAHWASRLDVVAALAGRRSTNRRPWRIPVLGGLALGLGMLAGLVGAARAEILLILPGLALCELGVLALTPGILSLAGLLAPRLPVALRIALRDASRSRTAAVPALAAVLAATTASVAIAVFAASYAAKERLQYVPQLPRNVVLVSLPAENSYAADAAVRDLRQYLSTSRVDVLGGNQCSSSCSYVSIERPPANQCDPNRMSSSDPRCTGGTTYAIGGLDQLVLTPDQLDAVARTVSPADRQALSAGKVLLRSALDLSGPGQVTVTRFSAEHTGQSTTLVLPAAVLSDPGDLRFIAVFSPGTAKHLGFTVQPTSVVARLNSPPTASQEEALTGALADYELGAQIEHGYVDRYAIAILTALIAAVVIALVATVLATALAVVDSRPDLATLWAVGAGPGVRRRLSVARSAVIAGIGVLLGTGLGFLPPWIVIDNQRRRAAEEARTSGGFALPHPFSVPWWPNVLGTALLIPLAAMLIAGLMTRARPPRPMSPG